MQTLHFDIELLSGLLPRARQVKAPIIVSKNLVKLPAACAQRRELLDASQSALADSSLDSQLLWHCNSIALQPRGDAFEPELSSEAASSFLQPQHFAGAEPEVTASASLPSQAQQSASGAWGWQWAAFSQTNAHFGFSQSAGRWHFQSQRGSSQTLSHAGVGLVHSVWHAGSCKQCHI